MQSFQDTNNPLTYFIQNVRLEMYSGDKPVDLMQLFPLAKQGIMDKRAAVDIIEIYCFLNNLIRDNIITFDEFMTVAFASDIPAVKYPGGRVGSISMKYALQKGIIDFPQNTIQILQLTRPHLVSINNGNIFVRDVYTSISEIVKYNSIHYNTVNHQQVEEETNLSTSIAFALSEANRLGVNNVNDVYSFIKFCITSDRIGARLRKERMEAAKQQLILTINRIITLPNIDLLCVSIIFNNVSDTNRFVGLFDPRNNNFKAYFLAIESGNQEIIDLVKNNIIQRDLLEQAVFNKQMASYTNLGDTLYKYSRQL